MRVGLEGITISWLEKSYMTESRKSIVVALEDLDFIWCEDEANEAAEMWRKGIPLDLMAIRIIELKRKFRIPLLQENGC